MQIINNHERYISVEGEGKFIKVPKLKISKCYVKVARYVVVYLHIKVYVNNRDRHFPILSTFRWF